jgi:Ca2+-transporting ATPase
VLKAGLLCNNSVLEKDENDRWVVVGDPTEGALVVSAEKAGFKHKHLAEECKRVFEVPFSSDAKCMTTVHKDKNARNGGGLIAYMKGATAVILDKCEFIEVDGKIKKLTEKEKEEIKIISREMANQALRVLGFAYKNLDDRKEEKEAAKGIEYSYLRNLKTEGFVFIGLQGMIDPPRPEVKEAVAKCKKAGIRIYVITGDHGLTARAIAKEIGIANDETRIIKGIELDE